MSNLSLIKSIFLKITFFLCVLIFFFLVARGMYLSPSITLQPITEVTFSYPTHVIQSRRDNNLYLVTEKQGRIVWFKEGAPGSGVVLDFTDKIYSSGWEEGLLSLVEDPEQEYVYLFYSLDNPKRSRISRFAWSGDGVILDPSSELTILEIAKLDDHHNGGLLLFGEDGYLYASVGDSYRTEELRTRKNLRGTIIRIDVSKADKYATYRIPDDNPFAGQEGVREEIYAQGFRNPWRFSFDAKTGEIYAADVGDVSREEINKVISGGDYGWPVFEGDLCIAEQEICAKTSSILPIASFSRQHLRSVTGGYVYRGKALPALYGKYIFADYLRGIYAIDFANKGAVPVDSPDDILLFKMPTRLPPNQGETIHVVSFFQESDRELLIVNLQGTIERIVEASMLDMIIGFLWAFASFR